MFYIICNFYIDTRYARIIQTTKVKIQLKYKAKKSINEGGKPPNPSCLRPCARL